MSGQVDGKVALLTGAASGIGAATVKLLLAEGATVIATDIDRARGEALVASLQDDAPGRITFRHHDVTDEARWQALIGETIDRHGRLDILINNAGVLAALVPLEQTTLEQWRQVLAVNLDGVFLGVKHGILAMKAKGGAIVNTSSVAALVGLPLSGAYNSSKAGVHLLTKSAALECAHLGYKIRVNSVHPGYIRTPMTDSVSTMLGDDRFERHASAITPLGHMGEPTDIAQGILYLASDQSSFVTGSALVIDGGCSAQ